MALQLLGRRTARAFLQRHWQKRPLFVRGALPGFRGVVGLRALRALAARDDVESRTAVRRGGAWTLARGPFESLAIPRAGFSLLVSGVNLHVPAADELLRRFHFIPQARLDDVMVSYAAPGGGVGPHVDSYDVFLLQGAGRRRWTVWRPGGGRHTYVAAPGDLLYLPPGWRHDGVALEPCFTYSIGFRAPRAAELGAAFLDWLHERGLPDASYRDPGLAPASHPGRIPPAMLGFAVKALRRISWTDRDVAQFLGRYLSEPKPHVVFRPAPSGRALRAPLAACRVKLDAKTQLLYLGARFFINGEALAAPAGSAALLRELADRRSIEGRRLAPAPLRALISAWLRAGYAHLERRAGYARLDRIQR